jgi:hypothetical protein
MSAALRALLGHRSHPRTGLSRLWRYTEGRRGRLSIVLTLAAVSAAAPVAGWHVVGDAIDNGIQAGDEQRLALDVAAYVAIGVVAWVLGTATWLSSRRRRPAHGARARRPLRAPDLASPATSRSRRRAGSSPA